MRSKLSILLLLVTPAFAARPTISSITVQGTTHTATNVIFFTSVPAACQLLYGTASGVYTYQGMSFTSTTANYVAGNFCAVTLTGLMPGTRYYVLPTARLLLNDLTAGDNCNGTGLGCGTSELIIDTPAQPAIHPAQPIAPTVTWPTPPDTSLYTVVNMVADGSGYCVAANNVAAPGGGHWPSSVVAGDSYRSVVSKVWYKTVIRHSQGSTCKIPDIGSQGHGGVVPPRYSPDGGPNDYLVIETEQLTPADFPPYGSRIGPQYASKLATIMVDVPAYPAFPNTPPLFGQTGGWTFYNGQFFDCQGCGANHIWFRNIQLADRFDSTLYPTGIVDPPAFSPYFNFSPSCNYTFTTACDPDPAATTTPHDIVIDRVYAPKSPYPSRQVGTFYPGGNNWTIIGSYGTSEFWLPAVYPHRDPTVYTARLEIPFSYYQLNQFDNNPIGMQPLSSHSGTSTDHLTIPIGSGALTGIHTQTGKGWTAGDRIDFFATLSDFSTTWKQAPCGMMGAVTSYNSGTGVMNVNITETYCPGFDFSYWRIEQPASIQFSGANLGAYTGATMGWIDSTGVVMKYDAAAGVTATCTPSTYCHVSSVTPGSLNLYSVPFNGQFWFTGSFSGGSYNLSPFTPAGVHTPSQYFQWRPMPVYFNAGNGGIFENNYIEGLGMTYYNDPQGFTGNILFRHNYTYIPRDQMRDSGVWNGRGYRYRQIFETKEMNYFMADGNYFDGSAANENLGSVFLLAGSFGGLYAGGVRDITVKNNVMRHVSQGIMCAGSGTGPPDPVPTDKFEFSNNLWIDLDKDHYSNLGFFPSFGSGLIGTMGPCNDINLTHNTVGLTHGNGPSVVITGGQPGYDTYATVLFGDGFKMDRNLVMMSWDSNVTPARTFGAGPSFPSTSNYPMNPYNPAWTTLSTWGGYFDKQFLHAGSTVVPDWTIRNNYFIGAQNSSDSGVTWSDISQATVNSIQSQWLGTNDKFAAGSTMSARMMAGGLSGTMNLKSGNPRLYKAFATADNPGDLGANVDTVLSATGTVGDVSVSPGATYLSFTYTAPDSRSCNVDVSANGTAWSRFTDSGGARARTVAATGLTATTAYQYRLLCYFDQTAAYEFDPDQVTSGTATTRASGTRSSYTGFSLPAGATQVLVTLTPASGTPVSATCTTSPCSIASVPVGTLTRTIQPQTSGAVAVGPAITSQITVQ